MTWTVISKKIKKTGGECAFTLHEPNYQNVRCQSSDNPDFTCYSMNAVSAKFCD